MDIRPILSILRRHRTAATLIVLEIALSCAIICNAVFLISGRLARMNMPSGLAEQELVDIQVSGIGTDQNAMALTREDLAALRAIPGVVSAAHTNQVPFGNGSWNSWVTLQPDQVGGALNATLFLGDAALRETFGVRLIAGRDFQDGDYVDMDPEMGFGGIEVNTAIITRAMAEKLYPGESAVGKVFYFGDGEPITIVGVVDRLQRPFLFASDPTGEYSMLLPIRVPYTVGGHYILRTTPDQRERVIKDAVAALEKNSNRRIFLEQRTFDTMREEFYRQDRSMAWLLGAVCIALLVVTALGIVGLASFWVQQRTKQIGVRRALGATRSQILRYFQTENFLLATLGIAIGMLLAYGINQLLMQQYELPRLPAYYLPAGAVVLWLLGQLAVLGPARRAAAVPPAVATRSV